MLGLLSHLAACTQIGCTPTTTSTYTTLFEEEEEEGRRRNVRRKNKTATVTTNLLLVKIFDCVVDKVCVRVWWLLFLIILVFFHFHSRPFMRNNNPARTCTWHGKSRILHSVKKSLSVVCFCAPITMSTSLLTPRSIQTHQQVTTMRS